MVRLTVSLRASSDAIARQGIVSPAIPTVETVAAHLAEAATA